MAALHRSAEAPPAGPLRRAAGSALVRLGLRLGYDGSVPPLVAQPDNSAGARFEPGTRTISPESDSRVGARRLARASRERDHAADPVLTLHQLEPALDVVEA